MSFGLILRFAIGFVIGYFFIPKCIKAFCEVLSKGNIFNNNEHMLNRCKALLYLLDENNNPPKAKQYFLEEYESIVKYINKFLLSNKKRKAVIYELQKVDCYIAKNFDYKSDFYKKHLELMNKYANVKKLRGGNLI